MSKKFTIMLENQTLEVKKVSLMNKLINTKWDSGLKFD